MRGNRRRRFLSFRHPRFGFCFDLVDIRVWNFPAEVIARAPHFQVLLKEDRPPGVTTEGSGSGQENVPYAILDRNFMAQKL